MNQEKFRRSVAKTYDQSYLYLELLLDGKVVACIHNIPKVWNMTRKESIQEYLDFEYNGISETTGKKNYLLSAMAMCVIFDDFEEHWL